MVSIEKLAKRFPMATIPRDDGPYLDRYYIYPPLEQKNVPWRSFIHNIRASDPDDALHNHPWDWAWSLILKGSYIEERLVAMDIGGGLITTYKRFTPGMINRLRSNTFHRLTIADDASDVWTLFVHGRRVARSSEEGDWGFVNREGDYTPHIGRTYNDYGT